MEMCARHEIKIIVRVSAAVIVIADAPDKYETKMKENRPFDKLQC